MTEAISREDVIAFLENQGRAMRSDYREAILSYLRPPPADDGVIGRPPGHCDDDEAWANFFPRYARETRGDLGFGDLTDFALANAQFMEDRNSITLVAYQTAAKERIGWLSVHLAIALARQAGATGEHPVSVVAPCPEGWKLVPREPTEPMSENRRRYSDLRYDSGNAPTATGSWQAMYDDDPPPPVQLSGNPGELPAPPPIPASALAEAFPDVGPRGQKWCQPGDRPNRQWMLIFDDPDRGRMFWDDEDTELQAREAFAKVWPSWSCTLFCAAPWSPAPPSDAVAELVAACEPFRRAASIRATMTGRGEQTRERFPGDDEVYPAGPITWGMLRRLAAAVAALPSPPSGRE